MNRHEATFEVDSKSDAHCVRVLLDESYDALREESKKGSEQANEMLAEFDSLREAARRGGSGRLTIVYERDDADS